MPSFNNFQSDNQKFEKDRYDIYSSTFENPIQKVQEDFITGNIEKWLELVSFLRFYPDYYYDLIKPKTGKLFKFDLDQRVMLRCLVRFIYNYDCIPRGGSKTLINVMGAYHICQFFPGITMSILASTKQSAVEIWEEKHNEILDFFPYIKDCIKSANFSKDRGKVEWVNGSVIDNLANSQSSKGKRRRRGEIEEDNLVDKDTYEDAISPIFNIPRRTMTGIEDPEELNGQVNRFTTSGYKNSDAYETIIQHLRGMTDLNGSFVYTSDWSIPVHFGRQKISTINNARKGSITRYRQNYLCDWVGSSDGALINISKLLKIRTLGSEDIEIPKDFKNQSELPEYIMGVDVARKINNKTAIVVAKIIKNNVGKIRQIHIVNITTPPQNLSYKEQSVIIKRVFHQYGGNLDLVKSRVKAVVIDSNSWGQGLVEALLQEDTDPQTNNELGCWDTMNTDDKPMLNTAPKVLYALTSQGINSDIIRIFVDYFESGKVKLIKSHEEIKKETTKNSNNMFYEIQCDQVTRFIDEVANLKLIKNDKTKTISIDQNIKSIDKDRYSAIAYLLYYIYQFMEEIQQDSDYDFVFSYN
jgi:ribonucleoside-diphosphate reductase alpha chain